MLEPGPDERRRHARRQPVDPAGRDGLRARHGLGERDGDVRQHAAASPTDVCVRTSRATRINNSRGDDEGRARATASPPAPPPTVVTDEFMDVQVIKDATAQVQLVNGQADIAYTVRVRNNGPNQAHNVVADGRGAERGHVPRGDAAAGRRQLHDHGRAAELHARDARPRGRADDRPLGTGHPDRDVCQLGDRVGDGKDTNGANNTDDASTLVTAPRDAADDDPEADGDAEADGRSRQPKPKPLRTSAGSSR